MKTAVELLYEHIGEETAMPVYEHMFVVLAASEDFNRSYYDYA